MLALHSSKLIFLKARRVAGTSFEVALSKYAREGDIVSKINADIQAADPNRGEDERRRLGFTGAQNHRKLVAELLTRPRPSDLRKIAKGIWPSKYTPHMSAADARAALGSKVWDSYTKLSQVRDPYDRAVSAYFFAMRDKGDDKPGFEEWCLERERIVGINREQYFIDGTPVVDIFVRYEAMEEDTRALEARVPGVAGLAETLASTNANTGHRPASARAAQMFADAPRARRLVEDVCGWEIETFGYSLP